MPDPREDGLREALKKLVNEAARALAEPRRFHENEDGRQHALADARIAALTALASQDTAAEGERRRFVVSQTGWAFGGDPGPLFTARLISGEPLLEAKWWPMDPEQGDFPEVEVEEVR